MLWNRREASAAYNPFSVDGRAPDKVVVISDWLKKIGGGVNTVMKDQIDCLCHDLGLAVEIFMEGGDYEAPRAATFNTFPDSRDADSIHAILRRHILEPAKQGQRIAAVLHNVLTVPFSEPLTQAFRRLVAEVQKDAALSDRVKFTAWTYDVFDVPDVMLPGVTYAVISQARQKSVAEYFHEPLEKFPVVSCAVNLRRMLNLARETDWLFHAFDLYSEDFVAFYPVRLARNKNIEGAIRIVAALNRLGRATTLLVPGATYQWELEYYHELRDLAGELKVFEKIIFLTDLTFEDNQLVVSDEVIRDLYKLSSFLLFTSRDEGFGLPVIEAACWRLPVVISPLEPLVDLSHDTGVLVADADYEPPESIARRIIEYLNANPAQTMLQRVQADFNMNHAFRTLGANFATGAELPWRIGAQTTNYSRRHRIEDQFLDALYNGLDAFEIFFDPQPDRRQGFHPEDLQDDLRRWLRENARQRNIHLSVCARRDRQDSPERRRHWESCLAFARDVGAATLVIHLPPPSAFANGDDDGFLSDLQDVIDAASADHIQTAIENGSYEDGNGAHHHVSAEYLNAMVGRLTTDEKFVGVSFNAGRANLHEDPLGYLAKVAAPVVHVKLSDNPGEGGPEVHQRLGEGNLPLRQLLQAFKHRQYRGTIVLEYFYADLREDRRLIAEQA